SPPSSGTEVATWVDKSGNARNAPRIGAAGTGAAYTTNQINGHPAMVFTFAASKAYQNTSIGTMFNGVNSYYCINVRRPQSFAHNNITLTADSAGLTVNNIYMRVDTGAI